jgi:hypothetical protein
MNSSSSIARAFDEGIRDSYMLFNPKHIEIRMKQSMDNILHFCFHITVIEHALINKIPLIFRNQDNNGRPGQSFYYLLVTTTDFLVHPAYVEP